MELEEWLQGVQPWLVGLEAAVEVDFSRASLVELEVLAAEGDSPAYEAYLGETLLRAGGGRWVEVSGEAGVTADPELGLPPVVPAELLVEPGRLVEVYDQWAAAVAARRDAVPGWQPVKEPTPGLDKRHEPAKPPQLRNWLAEREAGFAGWVARWAPDEMWDFSPSSLDRLSELLVRLLGSPQALKDPVNSDLVDGAVWYLGEAFRRAGGGDWSWKDEPGEQPMSYVVNLGRNNRSQLPLAQLRNGMRTPGYLHARCEALAD